MKTVIAITHLVFAAQVFGNDPISFQTAEDPDSGAVSFFELNKTNRAVVKIGDQDYIILELIDANREGDWETFSESCSISWTHITSISIQRDTVSGSKHYSSKQENTGSFRTSRIGGSDIVRLGGGISIRWSYRSRTGIFLLPSPGTVYATIDVEQNAAGQPATAPESKSEGNEKPKPSSEVRPQ